MLVMTTIYFAEVEQTPYDSADEHHRVLSGDGEGSQELVRELLSLYEGKNRVMPVDFGDQ